MRLIPLILLLCGTLAWATPPILLSDQSIDITTNFRGTEIVLTTYLETPDPKARLVIVGPNGTLTIRRKERRAGLWLNAAKTTLDQVPTYVALQGIDFQQLTDDCSRGTYQVYTPNHHSNLSWICRPGFRDLMANKGLFVQGGSVALEDLGQGFFRTTAFVPATAKPGAYQVWFTAGGDIASATINVQRAGLERLVLETAENYRVLYGILCLIIAALAGWVTNLIFSRR